MVNPYPNSPIKNIRKRILFSQIKTSPIRKSYSIKTSPIRKRKSYSIKTSPIRKRKRILS